MKNNMMRCQTGITLIEVVVAFFITTLSLGIIFQIYAKGVTAVVLANEYASALSIAESRLAEVSRGAEMRNYKSEGKEENRYDWTIETTDHMIADPSDTARTAYSLVQVDVNVSWQSRGKTRNIDLQTLKPIIVQ